MILIHDQRERSRFVRFALVGALGAVIDFLAFNILLRLGMGVLLAGTLSFIAAVSSNFTWNRYWTYPDSRSKPASRQMIQFLVVNVLGLGIRTLILAISEAPLSAMFTQYIQISLMPPDILGPNVALALAIGTVMFWNYFVNRYWTYNDIE